MNPYRKEYLKHARKGQKEKNEMAFLVLLRYAKLPEPKREHLFHPARKWRLDFAWPEYKIAVEIEGGIWRLGGGAHSHPTNIMRDIEKHNALALLGWRWLRFSDKEIRTGKAVEITKELLTLEVNKNEKDNCDRPHVACTGMAV